MPLASKRTRGDVNQPEWARKKCSQAVAAGWPWSTQYTRSIVSRPRSSGELEEEVIPGHLQLILVLVGWRGPDGKLGGKEVVPTCRRTGPHKDAVAGPLQDDLVAEPQAVAPLRRPLHPVPPFSTAQFSLPHVKTCSM